MIASIDRPNYWRLHLYLTDISDVFGNLIEATVDQRFSNCVANSC